MMLLIILGSVYTGVALFVAYRGYMNNREKISAKLQTVQGFFQYRLFRQLKPERFLRRRTSGKSAVHD